MTSLKRGIPGSVDKPINDSMGNGGIMKTAPIGLMYNKNPKLAFEIGVNIAALTHGHPNAYLPAGFLSSLIADLVNDVPLEKAIEKYKELGAEITIIKANTDGKIDYNEIEKNIKSKTKAIICTHASNVTGDILDIDFIGNLCAKHNILFILDASQSAGSIDIDMKKSNIDIICFTGHKGLMGPQGTGGLCIKKGIEIKPLKTGGSGIKTYSKTQPENMPTRLEAGTLNGHSIAGLNAALKFIEKEGIENIRKHEKELANYFYNGIKNIENIKFYGNYNADNRTSIVALNIGDIDSGKISDILANEFDIATRSGGHCAPLMHTSLDTVKQGIVRFSFSYFNTIDEIEIGINAVKDISKRFL